MSLYNGEASVTPSICPSVCKLLRKSLLLAGKWPDRHQTFTRWTPGQRASRMCSSLKVKVKVKGHVIRALSWILGMSYSVIDRLVAESHAGLLCYLSVCSGKAKPTMRTALLLVDER